MCVRRFTKLVAVNMLPKHADNARQGPTPDFGGKDPVDYCLGDVMIRHAGQRGGSDPGVRRLDHHELPDGGDHERAVVPDSDGQGAAADRRVIPGFHAGGMLEFTRNRLALS